MKKINLVETKITAIVLFFFKKYIKKIIQKVIENVPYAHDR